MAHNRRLTFLRYFLRTQSVQGFTLIEALVTISVVGVLAAIAAPNITSMGNLPLEDSVNRLSGQLRLVRSKAISQTAAYRIRWDMISPTDSQNVQTQFIVQRANSCNAAESEWRTDPGFTDEDRTTKKKVKLTGLSVNSVSPPSILDPAPATPAENWKVCINSRGLADKNVRWTFSLQEPGRPKSQQLEIFPGGANQVYAVTNYAY